LSAVAQERRRKACPTIPEQERSRWWARRKMRLCPPTELPHSNFKVPRGYKSAFPRRQSARVMHELALDENRGRRECRVTTSPMARLQQKKQAAVTTGRAGSTGIPCAMVLRVIRALLGDLRLVATVTREMHEHLRDLSACFGAPEPHDFPVRFRLRSSTHSQSVHRIPLPTSVTTAKRPSCGSGTAGTVHSFRFSERGIFARDGLTTQIRLNRFTKLDFSRTRFCAARGVRARRHRAKIN
jgi:hypothetical protein